MPYFLGICCSYSAFLIVYCSKTRNRKSLLYHFLSAVGLLMIGWLTFQATPFCGLAPLSFYALTSSREEWPEERKKFLIFLIALILSMLLFVAGYKVVLSLATEQKVYH